MHYVTEPGLCVAVLLTSVSMSTAVWMVMCRQPAIRAPLRGLLTLYFVRRAMRPGISFSAITISLRPKSAKPMLAVTKNSAVRRGQKMHKYMLVRRVNKV